MIAYRLWLKEPAGSANCPAGLDGCYNTGAYDPARVPKCYDAQQFANFNDLLAWATARGEQLMESSSAASAYTLCSATAPSANPLTPTIVSPPSGGTCVNCTTPGYDNGAPSATGNLPGGIGAVGGRAPGTGVLPPAGGSGSIGGRTVGGDVYIDPTTGKPYAPTTQPGTAATFPWWIAVVVILFLLLRR